MKKNAMLCEMKPFKVFHFPIYGIRRYVIFIQVGKFAGKHGKMRHSKTKKKINEKCFNL